MEIEDLAASLAAKRRELEQLHVEARSADVLAEFGRLNDEILALERTLAEARGEPYAVEWPMPEGADYSRSGGSAPILLGDAFNCYLTLLTNARQHAVLQFVHATGYKMNSVNDEVHDGHGLSGKGLMPWRSHLIKNSPWLAELESAHSVHRQYDPKRWFSHQHFLFAFQDEMFEAIAKDVQLLGVFPTLQEAIEQIVPRLHIQ